MKDNAAQVQRLVYAIRRVRRSTSTDAFQRFDAGRAGVHLRSEAVHRIRLSDVLTRIKKRERVPTCTVARDSF